MRPKTHPAVGLALDRLLTTVRVSFGTSDLCVLVVASQKASRQFTNRWRAYAWGQSTPVICARIPSENGWVVKVGRGWHLRSASGGFGSCGRVELEEVVGGAEHGPFGLNVAEPSEEELPESSGLLDLAEDGLDHLFSQAVSASSPGAADLVGQRLHQRLGFQDASGGGIGLAVADAAGREIGGDPTLRQGREVGFGGKPVSAEASRALRPRLVLIWSTSGTRAAKSAGLALSRCPRCSQNKKDGPFVAYSHLRAGSPISIRAKSRVVKRSASQTGKSGPSRRGVPLPRFVPPQLSQPVEKPPFGPQWIHEINLDGFRMVARIDNGHVQLLTRTGQPAAPAGAAPAAQPQ